MSTSFFAVLLLSTCVTCILSDDMIYCPRPVDEEECPLKHKINECCSQDDCRFGQICCIEPCGNVCRVSTDAEMGEKLNEGTECQLGENVKWYQKAWEKLINRIEEERKINP